MGIIISCSAINPNQTICRMQPFLNTSFDKQHELLSLKDI